ncbi:MAG TPA: LysR family transcriptional regulator [Bryobacteraceae bacterium]|nr:LysR family transcriptional regulator [Bryobacteraceae bacterium]
MDIRQLEIFLAVMEHSSVTRTAEKLYLSPGAVSLQLHNLAAELRTELFVHQGRRIVPTEQAFRLAEHAKHLMQKVREIQLDFANVAGEDVRPFYFATGATTLIHRLGGPLRLLRKRFPNADIHVTVAATEGMVAGLLDGHFDLALISLPWPQQALEIIPLFEEELLVLRPARQPVTTANVVSIQPAELADAPFLLYPKTSNMRSIIDHFFTEIGITPRVIMEADDTEAIKRLVEAGFGYSILPQFALRGRGFRFQTLRVAGHRLARQQALAMPKTEYPRALTLAIADFLKTVLARQ